MMASLQLQGVNLDFGSDQRQVLLNHHNIIFSTGVSSRRVIQGRCYSVKVQSMDTSVYVSDTTVGAPALWMAEPHFNGYPCCPTIAGTLLDPGPLAASSFAKPTSLLLCFPTSAF